MVKHMEQIVAQTSRFFAGDMGYVDEERFLFICDRLKELIKYKGLQVSSKRS